MFYAVALLLVLVFLVNLIIYAKARAHIYKNISDVPEAQAALIPGAALYRGGKLSPIFEDRVRAAIALYRAGKVSKILVSGDNSTVYYNEVNPVRTYLLNQGVPDENIFLDHAGFDTYSSMYRAKEVFQADSVIVASQAFHLPRAVFIGRALGLETYGFAGDSERVFIKNYIREAFADEKAVLDVLLHRKPKYLGEAIPLSGKGNYAP
jgi:SanA protein